MSLGWNCTDLVGSISDSLGYPNLRNPKMRYYLPRPYPILEVTSFVHTTVKVCFISLGMVLTFASDMEVLTSCFSSKLGKLIGVPLAL